MHSSCLPNAEQDASGLPALLAALDWLRLQCHHLITITSVIITISIIGRNIIKVIIIFAFSVIIINISVITIVIIIIIVVVVVIIIMISIE